MTLEEMYADRLFERILEVASVNETHMPMGNDVYVDPTTLLPEEYLRRDSVKLTLLIEDLKDRLADMGLRAATWWSGLEDGSFVVHVVHF